MVPAQGWHKVRHKVIYTGGRRQRLGRRLGLVSLDKGVLGIGAADNQGIKVHRIYMYVKECI